MEDDKPFCCEPHGTRHNQRRITKHLRVITANDAQKTPKLEEFLGKHWCDNCRKEKPQGSSKKRSKSTEPRTVSSKIRKGDKFMHVYIKNVFK